MDSNKSAKKNNSQVKVSQPIVGNSVLPQHIPSQADTLNTSPQFNQNINAGNTTLISELPMNQQQKVQVQNEVLDPSPLMAANEALGGIFGSSF